jgi:hypothetical protein
MLGTCDALLFLFTRRTFIQNVRQQQQCIQVTTHRITVGDDEEPVGSASHAAGKTRQFALKLDSGIQFNDGCDVTDIKPEADHSSPVLTMNVDVPVEWMHEP